MSTFFFSWYYYIVYKIRILFSFSKNDDIFNFDDDDILEFRDLDNSSMNSSTNSMINNISESFINSSYNSNTSNSYTIDELQIFLDRKTEYIDSVIESSENYNDLIGLKESIKKEKTIEEIVAITSYADKHSDYTTLDRALDFELSILDKKTLNNKYNVNTIVRRTDLVHLKRKLKKVQQYYFYKKAVKRHRDDLRKSITISNIDSFIDNSIN